jgi:hypothetical protein
MTFNQLTFHDSEEATPGSPAIGNCCAIRTAAVSIIAIHTIRDNGIQTDKEIQNPISEHKNNAHALNFFAIRNLYISH